MTALINNVDLSLLKVFRAVAHCGGYSAAQAELNVSPSTISLQMSDLEARLGLTLCRRGRAGFSLTPEGQAVLEASDQLFNHLEVFRSKVGTLTGKLAGELKIMVMTSNYTHNDFLLQDALKLFNARGGDVKIHLQTNTPSEMERAILDGDFHLAIGYFPRLLPQLNYKEIFHTKVELYCGKDHSLFDKPDEDIDVEEILASPHAKRSYVSVGQSSPLMRRLNTCATATTMEGLIYFVRSHEYHAFLANHLAAQWVQQGEMRSIRPDIFGYTSTLHIIWRKGQELNAISKAFLDDITTVSPLFEARKTK